MKIAVKREIFSPDFTIGKVYIDGAFHYYSCEDTVREIEGEPVSDWKIKGKTAIPAGKYRVIINFSNRFQTHLPLLLDVPGFTGIRIHAGNTAEDTEGCILLGTRMAKTKVLNSRLAMSDFMMKLREGIKKGNVTLEIS